MENNELNWFPPLIKQKNSHADLCEFAQNIHAMFYKDTISELKIKTYDCTEDTLQELKKSFETKDTPIQNVHTVYVSCLFPDNSTKYISLKSISDAISKDITEQIKMNGF